MNEKLYEHECAHIPCGCQVKRRRLLQRLVQKGVRFDRLRLRSYGMPRRSVNFTKSKDYFIGGEKNGKIEIIL